MYPRRKPKNFRTSPLPFQRGEKVLYYGMEVTVVNPSQHISGVRMDGKTFGVDHALLQKIEKPTNII